MIILKVTKKQGFTLSLEDTFFKKPHGGSNLPSSRFRVKTLLHHNIFQDNLFKTASFRNSFQKESVVKSGFNRFALCTLWACCFTKTNSILDVFLRTFETFAINFIS